MIDPITQHILNEEYSFKEEWKDTRLCQKACKKKIEYWKTSVPAAMAGILPSILTDVFSKRSKLLKLCEYKCYIMVAKKGMSKNEKGSKQYTINQNSLRTNTERYKETLYNIKQEIIKMKAKGNTKGAAFYQRYLAKL